MVNTNPLCFLCGQSVSQLGKQHGGLKKHTYSCKLINSISENDFLNKTFVNNVKKKKKKEYLSTDDVNHRFIDTNRKLK